MSTDAIIVDELSIIVDELSIVVDELVRRLVDRNIKYAALLEAALEVSSNEEQAFSRDACSYQKGSPTWQGYEDLRVAIKELTTIDTVSH